MAATQQPSGSGTTRLLHCLGLAAAICMGAVLLQPLPWAGCWALSERALLLPEMYGAPECCMPCTPHSLWALISPLLLRNKARNTTCSSVLVSREVLQSLLSMCWRSCASREGLQVAFLRISVCSCLCSYVCILFHITLQLWSFPESLLANLVTPKWETPSAHALCSNPGMKKCRQTFLQCHQ